MVEISPNQSSCVQKNLFAHYRHPPPLIFVKNIVESSRKKFSSRGPEVLNPRSIKNSDNIDPSPIPSQSRKSYTNISQHLRPVAETAIRSPKYKIHPFRVEIFKKFLKNTKSIEIAEKVSRYQRPITKTSCFALL